MSIQTSEQLLSDLQNIIDLHDQSLLEVDSLYFPAWDLRIHASQAESVEQIVVINYDLECPIWDRPIYETSVAIGEDAMGMAHAGFCFGLMNAVRNMFECDNILQRVETKFLGQSHRWSVYNSNEITIGFDSGQPTGFDYWHLLADDILARLGNQKLCYVKIFTAKIQANVTTECRINDIKNEALSQKVADYIAAQGCADFISNKQFFLLIQDSDTYQPYPFSEHEIGQHTCRAIELFSRCQTQQQYDAYLDDLSLAIGDHNLAAELYTFLPELCAEHAFDELSFPEQVTISYGQQQCQLYKNQLMAYYPIQKALYGQLGQLVDQTVYSRFISVSSVWSLIQQMESQGMALSKSLQITLNFSMVDDYLPR